MSINANFTAENSAPSDWRAWINMMPGAVPTLHVVGDIDVGNTSDSATLVFDSWEKSNPPMLVLRIVYQTIFVPRDDGDTKVLLHYTQQAMPGLIAGVIIVFPDRSFLKIENVSIAQ